MASTPEGFCAVGATYEPGEARVLSESEAHEHNLATFDKLTGRRPVVTASGFYQGVRAVAADRMPLAGRAFTAETMSAFHYRGRPEVSAVPRADGLWICAGLGSRGITWGLACARLTAAGIPVLAHVGMTPQSVNSYGGFKKQGKTREAAEKVLADAKAVEEAGAFAVTLECVPAELAAEITAALKIVTVGIGAGPVCDAQWLVMHDLLGLNEKVPSFVKKYANLAETVRGAFAAYVNEVKAGTFPS